MRANMLATTVAVSLIATTAAVSAAQLNLTQQQKQTIEQNLSSQKAENMPSGFTLKEGAAVPQSVTLQQIPSNLTTQIPSLKGNEFAKFDNREIAIVNSSSRKVEAVINQSGTTGSAAPGSMVMSS